MMEESDDDFKELCASFFQRVKKNAPKELSGEKKKPKASSIQIRSKQKRPRQTAANSKTLRGPKGKKQQPRSQAFQAKNQGIAKLLEPGPAPTENGESCALDPTAAPVPAPAPAPPPAADEPVLEDGVQNAQTEGAPRGDAQPPASGLPTAPAVSPSRPRTAELVLQRMQQFKRAHPTRLKHASEACLLEAATAETSPKDPQEERMVENGTLHFPHRGCGPGPLATESDAEVALALQQELGQEGAPAREEGLEEEGWFFCQICQKDLSAMTVTRREQHVNRCLDEAEKASRPCAPQIPGCPICGKLFLSMQSRSSHLKQCATRMEVCPQLLLQAVRLQTAQHQGNCSPATTPSPNWETLKRKGAPIKKEPQKRKKVSPPEAPSEDLLVAMALSRSELEQCQPVPALRLGNAFSKWIKLGAEKRGRKKLPIFPPPLLVQDSQATRRQMEDRVATLLAEEDVPLPSTPPLPTSRILEKEAEHASWRLSLPVGRQNFLWEGSALMGSWALEAFYTTSLVPPIVPWQPTQELKTEPMSPLRLPDQLQLDAHLSASLHSRPWSGRSPGGRLVEASPGKASPTSSQRERQALQDLVDLAREGLQPSNRGLGGWGEEAATDLVPSSLPLSGFVLTPKEELLERDDATSLSLGLLLADLRAMVNNPHLSDVQFQVDSGEVLYAHKFVLYARCPLLIQHVNSDGFLAVEDGDLRTHRVLLRDVSAEGAHHFLRYLYVADTDVPSRLAPMLHPLALRFGLSELAHLCKQAPVTMGMASGIGEKEEETCEGRADTFQDVLRSVWVEEEEEAEALLKPEGPEEDRENVDEAEMEEIYEFAATQRKLLREERAAERAEAADQLEWERLAPEYARTHCLVGARLEEDAGPKESPEQGSKETLAGWEGVGLSAAPGLWPQRPHSEDSETPKHEAGRETAECSSPSSRSSGLRAGRREGSRLHSSDGYYGYEQPLSFIQGEDSTPSQVTSDSEEQKGQVMKKGAEAPCSPMHQQEPTVRQPALGASPPWSPRHAHRSGGSSPSTPRSQSAAAKAVSQGSPVLPSKQRRSSGVSPALTDRSPRGGRRSSSTRARPSLAAPVSPEAPTSIDLTQPDSGAPPCRGRDSDVILLLDSDEELELTQAGKRPGTSASPEAGKGVDVSPRSSELFSIIDIDADLDRSPSLPGKDGELQLGASMPSPSGSRGSVGSRGRCRLFCDQESSPEEDSTPDRSWLVPATPLAGRSRHCTSQARGLHARTSVQEPRAAAAGKKEATEPHPVLVPQTTPPWLLPASPGSSAGRRGTARSPASGQSQPHTCPPRRRRRHSMPKPLRLSQAPVGEVVEVEDSDDELGVAPLKANSSPLPEGELPAPSDSWTAEPLSPIPIDHLNLGQTGPLSTSSPSPRPREAPTSEPCSFPSPLNTTPIRGSCPDPGGAPEQSPGASRLSWLNSELWDKWDGETSPEGLLLAQRQGTPCAGEPGGSETPKGARRKKNLPPKVPITPMPRYSILETPVLKKELDRFGVRPLPKRQMVLKLKEIFQYTHQTLESDSDDEIPSSQVPLMQATAEAPKTSRSGGHPPPKATTGYITQRAKGPIEGTSRRCRRRQPVEAPPALPRPPAKEDASDPNDEDQLPASQESAATSVVSSDGSWGSQSSACGEFGAAFESEGADEGEEGVPASQVASRAADTQEAVWHYIRSQPALYRRVLLYQPLELAELQAELRQSGIRVAAGKLLDFLDSQCITFTTAATRRERLEQKRRRPAGKKRRGQD
ncbi:structure-specific endonuclease subunit SLX4 isoform X2 [Echinops telfairi]|uniref:Structure-specific endonuclease subunit SLX4 isoform X2 n=1 Tax=Echinops telfairi TaxID=9371 RepID=A0AC55CNY4_ECHTE|nr:structure-specific endonuclease subunit SLX4 isoform X2 [Echinops telfairi]